MPVDNFVGLVEDKGGVSEGQGTKSRDHSVRGIIEEVFC